MAPQGAVGPGDLRVGIVIGPLIDDPFGDDESRPVAHIQHAPIQTAEGQRRPDFQIAHWKNTLS